MMSNKKTIPIEESTSEEFNVNKINESDKVIAIAGNPNVGKSTVSVSYTHLDVYKRQLQFHLVCVKLFMLFIFE